MACLAAALCSGLACAQPGSGLWMDDDGDALIRRTDLGNDGGLGDGIEPIDLKQVRITGWETPTPTTDPYTGHVATNADLLRLEIVFAGVVSPPGPLALGTAHQYDPFRFGPNPVYGFLDLDVDDQVNSGGELWPLALYRYLANVGRFGRTPAGAFAERVARSADDLVDDFDSDPQFERTGAEFAFTMCGCWDPQIVSETGDGDGVFEAGETWMVRGRFLERAQSFAPISGVFGGSSIGQYDPEVTVRWRHDTMQDATIIELIFPLTMEGAGLLSGQPPQAINLSVSDHVSIAEALDDLIYGAGMATGDLERLVRDWEGRDVDDYLEPTEWFCTALFGTTYLVPDPVALYVWTDTGFGEVLGDLDGDGVASSLDRDAVRAAIAAQDGGPNDADGVVDGAVTIPDFGSNFSIYDVDGDGIIGPCDVIGLGRGADVDGDGTLSFFDVSMFLALFASGDSSADLSGDGTLNFFDVSLYLSLFNAGCI